eukprot:1161500-Pyramimonas_sp.AAC.1
MTITITNTNNPTKTLQKCCGSTARLTRVCLVHPELLEGVAYSVLCATPSMPFGDTAVPRMFRSGECRECAAAVRYISVTRCEGAAHLEVAGALAGGDEGDASHTCNAL